MIGTDVKLVLNDGSEVYMRDLDVTFIRDNGVDILDLLVASVKEGVATTISLENVETVTFIERKQVHETKWTTTENMHSVKEIKAHN